jgi:hypothetical protein
VDKQLFKALVNQIVFIFGDPIGEGTTSRDAQFLSQRHGKGIVEGEGTTQAVKPWSYITGSSWHSNSKSWHSP